MRILIASLIFCLSANALLSQEASHRDDFEFWMSATLNKKINKKWTVQLSFADRLDNNARFQKVAFVEPKIIYKVHKRLETGMAYRFSYDPLDLEQSAKLISRTTANYRLKPIDISYRIRLDKELDKVELLSTFRNKLGIRYKRKKHKLAPGISFELFTNNRRRGWIADKLRLKGGFHYRLNKKHRFSIDYILQREFNQSRPNQDFILSTSYKYYLQTPKKEEKVI